MKGLLATPGPRAFLRIWLGLTVSMLGSMTTAFALGIWIFQDTASTTKYALVMLCAALPPLVMLPLVGPLIDRYPRRRILVLSDVVAAAAVLALGVLSATGRLNLAAACAIVTVTSAATALQLPTYLATVTVLVPIEQLGRASGLTQLAQAIAQVVSPLLAGVLMVTLGLAGIAWIDTATFLVSITILLSTSIPDPPVTAGRRVDYLRDLPVGWRTIAASPGLVALLVVFLLANFFSEVASVLFTPFVLSFSTPQGLGMVLTVGGLGMLAGGAVMTVWGGPRRPALGATLFAAAAGVPMLAAGVAMSTVGLALLVAAYFFFLPLLAGSSQVVWQRCVPADVQGRVFATRTAIVMAAAPLAPLVAGPLADRIFEPAMVEGRTLAAVLGPWIGTGPGRGMAVILALAGLATIAVGMAGALHGPLRRLDRFPDSRDSGAASPSLHPTSTATNLAGRSLPGDS